MIQRTKQTRQREAFTLMEMLVVVAIIVVLAGAGIPIYMNYIETSKRDVAKRGVMALEQAIKAYQIDETHHTPDNPTGLPPSLEVLAQADPQAGTRAALPVKALYDPWNQPYQYDRNRAHSQTGVPLVWSNGPPGGQPIYNWIE